mmetsp:Transcript_26861/g.57608  ORF Transcript_26861/g.57608 Transcript_26861/m.57608 type:complete len:81 (+) Transcript_26861:154-396(+)
MSPIISLPTSTINFFRSPLHFDCFASTFHTFQQSTINCSVCNDETTEQHHLAKNTSFTCRHAYHEPSILSSFASILIHSL